MYAERVCALRSSFTRRESLVLSLSFWDPSGPGSVPTDRLRPRPPQSPLAALSQELIVDGGARFSCGWPLCRSHPASGDQPQVELVSQYSGWCNYRLDIPRGYLTPAEDEARSRTSEIRARSGHAAVTVIGESAAEFRPLQLMLVGWMTEQGQQATEPEFIHHHIPPHEITNRAAAMPRKAQAVRRAIAPHRLRKRRSSARLRRPGAPRPSGFQKGPFPYPSNVPSLPSCRSLTRFSTLNCASNLM